AWAGWREACSRHQHRLHTAILARKLLARLEPSHWQLAALVASWQQVAQAAAALRVLKAEAMTHGESAERTLETAEKAVLLSCIFKAWAEWAAAEQAEQWLELQQAESCLAMTPPPGC
ncbi:unnamed protein product, partial [Polarella glacialis]